MFYDPKRKRIVDFGSSRPCGYNHSKFSIHAEQLAIEYCKKYDKRNRYQIFISRYSKKGFHKPTYCCNSCTKLVKKYNFEDRIFTILDNNIVKAVIDNPILSLSYIIKYDLKYEELNMNKIIPQ